MWQVTRTFSNPYSYADAIKDFMALLNQAKVTATGQNFCGGFGSGLLDVDYTYDADGAALKDGSDAAFTG